MYEEDSEVLRIAREIEVYLNTHPNAADTLDGILRWWLSRIHIEQAACVVELAIKHLQKKNAVIKTVSVDGKDIYSLSKDIAPLSKKKFAQTE